MHRVLELELERCNSSRKFK